MAEPPPSLMCGHCSSRIAKDPSLSVSCAICKTQFHISCVTGLGATLDTIRNCKKRSTQIVWLCQMCRRIVKSDNERIFTQSQFQARLETDVQRIITERHKDNQIELNRVQQENTAQKAQIQDMNCRINTIRQSTSQQAGIIDELQRKLIETERYKLELREDSKRSLRGVDAENEIYTRDTILSVINMLLQNMSNAFNEKLDNIINTLEDNTSNILPRDRPARNQSRYRSQTPVQKDVSFAQVWSKAAIPRTSYRNNQLQGNDTQSVNNQLRDDHSYAEVGIVSINNKTVKCTSEGKSKKLEESISTKYREAIKTNSIPSKSPQVKITNFNTEMSDENIIQMLKIQNSWLNGKDFVIDRKYTVVNEQRSYSNIIVNCDLNLQKTFIERGYVIFGFSEKKCYEYINLIQCNKCFRFDHVGKSCNFARRCKKCGDTHHVDECTSDIQGYRCPNCKRSNENGTNFATNHIVTHDRCQSRIARIEELTTYR